MVAVVTLLRVLESRSFTCVSTHVNFNHVNKVEARYKALSLNVKLSEVQLLRLRATFHTLPLPYLLTQIIRTYARKHYTTVEIHLKRECRSGGNRLSNVRRFIILRSGEGVNLLH